MNPIRQRIAGLSEREKQVLRLLLGGYDAKSIARELGLSVHTVNDHLREARRKLAVSSSREAARQLAASEDAHPKRFAPKDLGIGENAIPIARQRFSWFAGGMLIMSLIVAASALAFAYSTTAASVGAVPKVIATSPRQAAAIKPGRFFVSVTYDEPMWLGSFSFAGPTDLAPKACGTPQQSKDQRTFRLCYIASPESRYEIWFNREPYMNFKSASGVPAEPYRLIFTVTAK